MQWVLGGRNSKSTKSALAHIRLSRVLKFSKDLKPPLLSCMTFVHYENKVISGPNPVNCSTCQIFQTEVVEDCMAISVQLAHTKQKN